MFINSFFLSILQTLEILTGGLSLFAKISFWRAEQEANKSASQRRWILRAWSTSIAAWPLWVLIFSIKDDFIAAGNESSAIPAMIVGLLNTRDGKDRQANQFLVWVAHSCVVIGLCVSIWHVGPLTELTQWL